MLPSAREAVAKNDATASSEAEKGAPSIDLGRLDLLSGASAPPPSSSSSSDRPIFHVMPRSSWINDPNGLCFHKGRFHAFYQHIEKEGSADWDWAMAWGHASSADLAFWRREPVALRPTTTTRAAAETETAAAAVPSLVAAASASAAAAAANTSVSTSAALSSAGGADAAGCWSGCLVAPSPRHARAGMRPTLLYTGVVLRKDHEVKEEEEEEEKDRHSHHHSHHHRLRPHAPPPPLPLLADLGLEMIERQLVAVLSSDEGGDENEERLTTFDKRGVFISRAPYEPLEEEEAAASEAVPASASTSSSAAAKSSSSPSQFFRYDSGFRDPFVYQRHDASRGIPWRVLIGSGKRRVEKKKVEVEKKKKRGGGDDDAGETGSGSNSASASDEEQEVSPATGTLLAYSCRTADLALGPWTFEGEVVKGEPGRCVEERSEGEEEQGEEGGGEQPSSSTSTTKTAAGEKGSEKKKQKKETVEFDVGRMWECPFLIEVPVVVAAAADSDSDGEGDSAETKKTTSTSTQHLPTSLHLLCVSPYPHGPAITATGRPANPPLYWLGELEEGRGTFDFARAVAGPRRLDLGDILYAPTAAAAARSDEVEDEGERGPPAAAARSDEEEDEGERGPPVAAVVAPPVMMAWAQELRGSQKAGFTYSGALTLPRELSVVAERKRKKKKKTESDNGGERFEFRLRQRPPASISKLRKVVVEEESVSAAAGITAFVGGPAVEIPGGGAGGPFADLELELVRPAAAAPSTSSSSLPAAVVLLRPWPHAGTETGLEPCAAAVVADWDTGELSVVWPRKLSSSVAAAAAPAAAGFYDGFMLDSTTTTVAPDAQKEEGHSPPPPSSSPPLLRIDWEAGVSREVGGPCAGLRKGSVTLRVIVDGSLVEVFASSGEALTTRVYRGGGGVGGSNGGGGGSSGGGGSNGGEQSEQSSSSRGGQGDQSHPFYFLAREGKGGSGSGAVTASRARSWGMRSCWVE